MVDVAASSRLWMQGHAKHVTPSRKARYLARGKRSATPGIHHPPPSCVRRGRELHHPPCNFGGIHGGGVCNRAAVVRYWDGGVPPHSRLRRQCGVIEVVTAPRLSSTTAKADGCRAYAIRPYSIHLRRGSPMCSTTYTTTPRPSNSNNYYHTKISHE